MDADGSHQLYYLHPLPTKYEHKLVTIIPNVKYLLKSVSSNIVIPLNDICAHNEVYRCTSLLSHRHCTCDGEVILHKTS